jgi:hypothetical protein
MSAVFTRARAAVQGDMVQVLKQKKIGWWKAKLGTNLGYIPANYVKVATRAGH